MSAAHLSLHKQGYTCAPMACGEELGTRPPSASPKKDWGGAQEPDKLLFLSQKILWPGSSRHKAFRVLIPGTCGEP